MQTLESVRKVVVVGTGMVGMSYAYALLNQNACDEIVLVDVNRERAEGEAMDLNHGLAFSGSHMRIWAGNYKDCADADLVALCAGVAQKPGESRPALLSRNLEVFRSIVGPIVESGFEGVFLVATNPVDVMAHITQKLSGFAENQVFGTGTVLDTARLRYLLGNYIGVDPRNVHAYVLGEHGDSEFVPWSQAMVATVPLSVACERGLLPNCDEELEKIETEVRTAAQKIIAAKRASYYGIGMAMVRITRAVFGDENSVLTVSSKLSGEYAEEGVYVGAPCVVGRTGVRRVLSLPLEAAEGEKLHRSCQILKELYAGLNLA